MIPPQNILVAENSRARPQVLLSGWAMLTYQDQPVGLALPGSVIGAIERQITLQVTSLTYCVLRPATPEESAHAAADLQRLLLRQLVRTTGKGAVAQVSDFFMETLDRLGNRENKATIHFPLTQLMIARLLGLSSIHTNRVFKILRERNILWLKAERLELLNRKALEISADGEDGISR